MKLSEIFEVKEAEEVKVADETGTYVAVKFDKDSQDSMEAYLKEHNIPNATTPDKFHVTLIYSRKHCPDYNSVGKLENPITATPSKFEIWKTQTGSHALVLKLDCPELVARHEELMKEHGATYDYDEYKTHVTFSYDVGDASVEDFPAFTTPLTMDYEYGEDLDLDWATNATDKDKKDD